MATTYKEFEDQFEFALKFGDSALQEKLNSSANAKLSERDIEHVINSPQFGTHLNNVVNLYLKAKKAIELEQQPRITQFEATETLQQTAPKQWQSAEWMRKFDLASSPEINRIINQINNPGANAVQRQEATNELTHQFKLKMKMSMENRHKKELDYTPAPTPKLKFPGA